MSIHSGKSIKCPNCGVLFLDPPREATLVEDDEWAWVALTRRCPACRRVIISLACVQNEDEIPSSEFVVEPRTAGRDPVPGEVPLEIANDYREACLVLTDSPRASAALSRRCLQHILRETAGVKPSTLAEEIKKAICAGFPSHIAGALDDVRVLGNFAAHPEKDTRTGEIIPVEPAEAEHNLDVIEALFDHFFVQPEKTRKRRDAVNRKLVAAGKKPLDDQRAAKADDSSAVKSGPTTDGD